MVQSVDANGFLGFEGADRISPGVLGKVLMTNTIAIPHVLLS